ncbi:MAG: thiosulfate sulfurtransferase [Gammaproteobacteria bacterium]|nr:rhodanese-like domain-containing protein [bacterium AH-315-E07]PCH61136.1 MAG: thiosulfate sulfurtransferase [Gammaproteobacteria bacterium]
MRHIILFLSIVFMSVACTADQSDAQSSNDSAAQQNGGGEWRVQNVEALEARDLIATVPNIVVLDVRTPKEYGAGHISGGKNIDFFGQNFESQLSGLNRATPYLLHCKSGGRSSKVLKVMERLGFKNIYHLEGGFDAWKNANFDAVS